jgi:hypothetical protein
MQCKSVHPTLMFKEATTIAEQHANLTSVEAVRLKKKCLGTINEVLSLIYKFKIKQTGSI